MWILDFLFPKSPRAIELESLPLESLPVNLSESEDGVTALFNYSHPVVKEIIWEIKYAGNKVLSDRVGEILYDFIAAELEEHNIFGKFETVLLLPIPISDKRRFERGWNQCELLAAAVKRRDKENRYKYLARQLSKARHTESQTKTATREERRKNLKNSMKVLNPAVVAGRCVVAIDDVVTTGSTFAEVRRALKEAGAKKIFCFALAH